MLSEQRVTRQFWSLDGAGDFDGDGYPDYFYANPYSWNGAEVTVWSPFRRHALFNTNYVGPIWGWSQTIAGRLDFNGDGQQDLIVSGGNPNESIVYAYDHSGTVAYTIPARAMGFVVRQVAAVGDLDHDGCDDYIVGGTPIGDGRGAVVLISGRTGAIRRIHSGPFAGALVGDEVWPAGDMDGDGVMDYAAGNKFGSNSGVVMVWSGATGALQPAAPSSRIRRCSSPAPAAWSRRHGTSPIWLARP